jgi:predicted LPLAT superfamily acyltransferase
VNLTQAPTPPPLWKAAPERGNVLATRLLVALDRILGRRSMNVALWCIATYFALTAPAARAASRQFWVRLGHAASFFDCIRHFFVFARVALDRALFATGRIGKLHISLVGHEHIMATQGALIFGAHLGSFEALQALALQYHRNVTAIVDVRNAQRLAAVMKRLAPHSPVRFIAIDETDPTSILQVTQAVTQGDLVAILADRLTADSSRSTTVSFLGEPAKFPTGPFIMAHALGCPVLFACALYQAPNRYTLHCKPLTPRLVLPRAARDEALRAAVTQYANTLEDYTRQAPNNWFNFFEFWAT